MILFDSLGQKLFLSENHNIVRKLETSTVREISFYIISFFYAVLLGQIIELVPILNIITEGS
jgi:hypothetical protein